MEVWHLLLQFVEEAGFKGTKHPPPPQQQQQQQLLLLLCSCSSFHPTWSISKFERWEWVASSNLTVVVVVIVSLIVVQGQATFAYHLSILLSSSTRLCCLFGLLSCNQKSWQGLYQWMNENIVHHDAGKECCLPLVACLLACCPHPPPPKKKWIGSCDPVPTSQFFIFYFYF